MPCGRRPIGERRGRARPAGPYAPGRSPAPEDEAPAPRPGRAPQGRERRAGPTGGVSPGPQQLPRTDLGKHRHDTGQLALASFLPRGTHQEGWRRWTRPRRRPRGAEPPRAEPGEARRDPRWGQDWGRGPLQEAGEGAAGDALQVREAEQGAAAELGRRARRGTCFWESVPLSPKPRGVRPNGEAGVGGPAARLLTIADLQEFLVYFDQVSVACVCVADTVTAP